MIKRALFCPFFALLLFPMFFGCEGPVKETGLPRPNKSGQHNETGQYASYRDIPGITYDEIHAIEALKEQREFFVSAMGASTETFNNENGDIRGFTALFCQWLTGLFGIPFEPAIYEWGDLLAGLETRQVDFTGELTPTDERRKTYVMTSGMAERLVKTFRIEGSRPLAEIAEQRPLRCAFPQGAVIIDAVTELLQDQYEIVQVYDNESAYKLLKNGEADAFFSDSTAEAAFDVYGDVVAADFFPLIFSPVSLTTKNPALAPVISVVQKALEDGSIRYLAGLYKLGYQEYLRHKLFLRFSEEELAYIQNHPAVPFAAETSNYPVSFYNAHEKKWQGVAFDVLKEVEDLTGLRFELVNDRDAPWHILLSMLENGEAAMISELIRSDDREGRFLWANTSNMSDFYALISKSDYRSISLNEILYVKVGTIKDTAYAEVFNRWFPDHMSTIEYQNTDIAMDALERGEIEVVMANQSQLLMMTNYRELVGYKTNVVFTHTFESAFGFHIEQAVLCSIVDKALKMIDTKGISEQWMRKTYDYRAKLARTQLPWVVGATTLLFVFLLVFVLLLRKHGEGRRLEGLIQKRTVELDRQYALTCEVNNAAILLLGTDAEDFSASMIQGMQMIARCMEVDRISIWQNYWNDDGKRHYRLVCQWAGEGIPNMDKDANYAYQDTLPSWEKLFVQKFYVNGPVDNLDEPEYSNLTSLSIQSLFAMPIFLQDQFWGFINFSDYRRKRFFPEVETHVLRSWGLLAVGAIQRGEIAQGMHRTLNKLEAIINNYKGLIWSVDTTGTITTFSGQYLTKMGMKSSFFEGKNLELARQKNRHLDIIEYVEKTIRKGPQNWTSGIDGGIFHSATTPMYDTKGNVTGVVGSTDDVTEFYELQRELEAALEAAKVASHAKSSFLANMSHAPPI